MSDDRPRASGRRGGRRPERVEDTTPRGDRFGGIEARIAWLLRTHRLAHDGGRYARSQDFVTRLGELDISANPSRITRWESPQTAVVSAAPLYEQALGLPHGRLTAVLYGAERSLSPDLTAARPISTRPPGRLHAELDDLLDRLQDRGATTADWFGFSSLVQGRDDLYLPRQLWRTLTTRLVADMARSVGTAYVTRFEALRSLLAHPGAQPQVLLSIRDFVTEPHCQVVPDPLTLLQSVRARPVVQMVSSLMQHPDPDVRRWAAWTAAGKIARRQVDDGQLAEVAVLLATVAAENDRALHDLEGVVGMLPADLRAPVTEALARRGQAAGEAVWAPPARERTPRAMAWLASRIAANVEDEHDLDPADPMLERLLDEALWHHFTERRHQAALLLLCSPFAETVAQRAARELRREPRTTRSACGSAHHDTTRALLRLLSYLGRPEDVDVLYPHVRVSRCPVRVTALHTLGHVPHELDLEAVAGAVRGEDTSESRAALYALGMHGSPVLEDLATDDSLPDRVTGGAAWWRAQGPALLDDAHR